MKLRMSKVDELQLLVCLKHGLWGAKIDRFKNWEIGDLLVFVIDKTLAALAEVSGNPYVSGDSIWVNGVFPHRIPVHFHSVLKKGDRPPILGELREAIRASLGRKYGIGLIVQKPLLEEHAQIVLRTLESRRNVLHELTRDLDQLMIEAAKQRGTRYHTSYEVRSH